MVKSVGESHLGCEFDREEEGSARLWVCGEPEAPWVIRLSNTFSMRVCTEHVDGYDLIAGPNGVTGDKAWEAWEKAFTEIGGVVR